MKKKLSLNYLKVTSFVTSLESQNVRGGLRWESADTCPDECGSEEVTIPCSIIPGCQGTIDCDSYLYPTNCVFYCN